MTTNLATITTDTGAFASGPTNFARYTTPGQCVVAAADAQALQRNAEVPVFADERVGVDTAGAGRAAAVAQACAAQLPAQTVPYPAWGDLFQLAVYARADSLALHMLAQKLATASPAQQRQLDLAALNAFIASGQWQAVKSLDSLIASRGASVVTRTERARLAAGIVSAAQAVRDTARVLATLRTEWTLLQGLPLSVETFYAQIDVLERSAHLVAMTHPDSVTRLAVTMQRLLAQYPQVPGLDTIKTNEMWAGQYAALKTLPQIVHWLLPRWLTYASDVPPTPLVPLPVPYLFPATGVPASASGPRDATGPTPGVVQAAPGQVTLVCKDLGLDSMSVALGEAMRSWVARYGRDRLALVLVFTAAGVTRVPVTRLNVYERSVTPAEEAAQDRWFSQTYLRLPATIAVQAVGRRYLPAPDGRLIALVNRPFLAWFGLPTSEAVSGASAGPPATSADSIGLNPGEWMGNLSFPLGVRDGCLVTDRAGRVVYRSFYLPHSVWGNPGVVTGARMREHLAHVLAQLFTPSGASRDGHDPGLAGVARQGEP